jgi:hypothetical protein
MHTNKWNLTITILGQSKRFRLSRSVRLQNSPLVGRYPKRPGPLIESPVFFGSQSALPICVSNLAAL